MTLAGNTDFHCGSIDTNFDPPQFPLDSTFKLERQLENCYSLLVKKQLVLCLSGVTNGHTNAEGCVLWAMN
jgi:hypothetical protein